MQSLWRFEIYPVILLLLLLLLCFSPGIFAEETQLLLEECSDNQLGFKILCGPDWTTVEEPLSLIFFIHENEHQSVILEISKSDEYGITYDDLTASALQDVYEYENNFRYARTQIKDHKIVFIEAQSNQDPKIQLIDYFIIRDKELYRVSFRVYPKEQSEQYKTLFKTLIESFDFLVSEEKS